MRIAIYSDLHLEHTLWTPPRVDADVVVLAGDIDELASGSDLPAWAQRRFPGCAIIWVLGNHEYYRFKSGMGAALELARSQAESIGVHLLEMDSVDIAGVRFAGCTLWSDFALLGDVEAAKELAGRAMADFNGAIRLDDGDMFAPIDSIEIHRKSAAWLDAELAKPFGGKTVVVTHHSPHPKCEHRLYENSPLSPAFCSDLGWIIERHQPVLWISGHTHASHDVRMGATRLVSNQRGYRDTPEHLDAPFNPIFVVDL